MKLTLLLIPLLLFMTSCTLYQDKSASTPESITNTQSVSETPIQRSPEQDNSGIIKDFGSGFTLHQTDDETLLSYSGKVVKTWSHNPPREVPFIWDEACTIVWKGFEKLTPENQSTGKQGVWDALTENQKKECMKESYKQKISIKKINQTFFEIRELRYENYRSWLYDGTTGNIQDLPIEGQDIQISKIDTGISVFIVNNYDGDDIRIIYSPDFSKIISKENIPKVQ